MCTMYSNQPYQLKMEGLRTDKSDLFFTAYGQSDHCHTTAGPRAKKVSLDGSDTTGTSFLPTPPDSPVFAELTTAGQVDRKPNLAKLNSQIQAGARAVPNLDMNPSSITDFYNMNTVYSPLQQPLSPSFEGSFCDDPLGGSNNVLVKQEISDTYPDVFPVVHSPLDMSLGGDHSSLQQQEFFDWSSQTIFEAPVPEHPHIKDAIPSFTNSFDSSLSSSMSSISSLGYHSDNILPSINHFGRERLNSGREENEDSCSEASFDLSTGGNVDEDNLDEVTSFDPSDLLTKPFEEPRTHNYKRNTLNQSVAMLSNSRGQIVPMVKGTIPKVATSQSSISKKRGRLRKPISESFGTRPGRGRREAMKGNHLWEFIRDLLKDNNYCPKFIRWEEKDEGVFRFVNSEAVAKMWGCKKNNPAMTYEKLSRSMRYYYKREILERVDGRRLVYKFGKNAVGWREQPAESLNESVD